MGLLVLGLQQSAIWGWSDAKTWACIVAGVAILVAFVLNQLRVANPLLRLRIFKDRAFAVDNVDPLPADDPVRAAVLLRQQYAQISLGERASETGLYLLIFFAGFAIASQWGGKVLDRVGRAADGGRRLRGRRRRLLPLGQLADRTLGLRPVVLHRHRRGRGRARPQPRQHRRPQPGAARAATARRPGSPRRCGTSAPASASRSSARS